MCFVQTNRYKFLIFINDPNPKSICIYILFSDEGPKLYVGEFIMKTFYEICCKRAQYEYAVLRICKIKMLNTSYKFRKKPFAYNPISLQIKLKQKQHLHCNGHLTHMNKIHQILFETLRSV